MNGKKTAILKKHWYRIILAVVVSIIFVLQIRKRNNQIELKSQNQVAEKLANSPYVKLLNHIPVYRDSLYRIYIANISGKKKIIFLAEDHITDVQRESKFFVHLYPKDTAISKNTKSLIAYDFSNKPTSFRFRDKLFYVSQTDLPDFKIDKINLGQYGYKGNNNINWKITELLRAAKIKSILRENKEDMSIIEGNEKSF